MHARVWMLGAASVRRVLELHAAQLEVPEWTLALFASPEREGRSHREDRRAASLQQRCCVEAAVGRAATGNARKLEQVSRYRFDYPPENIIVDVRRFAQQHDLYMYFNFVTEE